MFTAWHGFCCISLSWSVKLTSRELFLLAILLAITIFVVDLLTPLGVMEGVPYVAVVLIALWLPGQRSALLLAAVCSALSILGLLYSPPGGELWKVVTNRWLAVIVIWVTALLCFWRKQGEKALLEGEERLRAQAEELARSNIDLERFAYLASHDLQEPLRKVEGFTLLLAERYQGQLDAQADKFMGYVVDGARRMRALVTDLLKYSRVGKGELSRESTDLSLVVEKVLTDLEPTIREGNASVTHGSLPTAMAEPSLMAQLLQNLIANGLKFHGEEPPHVHVSAEQKDEGWVFSVNDNGIGIAEEYCEQIFTIFQRLHSRAEYPGTGMGLAICKKIVEQHGGRIWVESRLGQGSTFYFTIA